jgi:hypothetical protein
MLASFVAYFLVPTEEFAALSADSFMASNNKLMKLVWFVIFAVFIMKIPGYVAIVEKKEMLEYRTMHSSYQITACLDEEQSVDSFCVAFATHCWQMEEETSPLHMYRPYTVFERVLFVTVVL